MHRILRSHRRARYDPNHMTGPDQRNSLLPLQTLLPAALRRLCTPVDCTKGDLLFRQGKRPERMVYVARGEVVLQRPGSHGEIVVLQRTRQGFVAESSLQSSRYHCDAVVTVSGALVGLPIEPIKQALLDDPAFAMRWIGMLNQEMKRLRAHCERLAIKGVRDRLLHLIETEGQVGRLPLGAGLKSMALELGVSHEALYRTVAELEKRGLLRRENGQLIVL
jgi:CRP-like cAMP-binding protein